MIKNFLTKYGGIFILGNVQNLRGKEVRKTMKKGRFLISFLAIAAFLVVGYTVAMSGSGPENIVIKDSAFGTFHKKGVCFTHKKHGEMLGCVKCHHTYKDDAAVKAGPVKKCSACHKANPAEKNSLGYCERTYKGKAPGLKCAYHMNCWGCHKKAKKQGKPAPTSCSKCHSAK